MSEKTETIEIDFSEWTDEEYIKLTNYALGLNMTLLQAVEDILEWLPEMLEKDPGYWAKLVEFSKSRKL